MYDFSWFLRDCALRDYAIFSETQGEVSTRAYERCQRFLAMADLLYTPHCEYDLEYEYRKVIGDFDF